MSSRSIDDLDTRIKQQAHTFMDRCVIAGIDLLITCTLRSLSEQAFLYSQGRTTPGPHATIARPLGDIVTKAKPGESSHNYGFALDVVPLIHGKPLWTFDVKSPGPIWSKVGELGISAGLEWFGAPNSPFLEGCHFQLHGWRDLIKQSGAA